MTTAQPITATTDTQRASVIPLPGAADTKVKQPLNVRRLAWNHDLPHPNWCEPWERAYREQARKEVEALAGLYRSPELVLAVTILAAMPKDQAERVETALAMIKHCGVESSEQLATGLLAFIRRTRVSLRGAGE